MVTVSIAETTDVIRGLLQKILPVQSENLVFLPAEPHKQRDVVLLHQPVDCQGNIITMLNTDEPIPLYNPSSVVITYGLNPLSTVTASSISTEEGLTCFSCCLQRSIVTLRGEILEPQEFPVAVTPPLTDVGAAIGLVTAGLIFSVPPEAFSDILKG